MVNRIVEVHVDLFTDESIVRVGFERADGQRRTYQLTVSSSTRIENVLEDYHYDESYTAEMLWTLSSGFVMMWWEIKRQEVVTLVPA